MAALSKPRKTIPVFFTNKAYKMKADAVIFPGGMVGADASGWAVPASASDSIATLGVAGNNANDVWDNTGGGNGAMSVNVDGSISAGGRVAYWLDNAPGGDAVTQAQVGRRVYFYDDHTVQSTATGSNVAGTCREVSSTLGVLVEFDAGEADEGDDALAAAQAAQTTANLGTKMQAVNATLASGTVTINTGITVAANSEVVPVEIGAITGSTNFGSLRELKSSRVNGAPGTGTVVVEAVGSDGAKDTDAAGAIRVLIFTPVS